MERKKSCSGVHSLPHQRFSIDYSKSQHQNRYISLWIPEILSKNSKCYISSSRGLKLGIILAVFIEFFLFFLVCDICVILGCFFLVFVMISWGFRKTAFYVLRTVKVALIFTYKSKFSFLCLNLYDLGRSQICSNEHPCTRFYQVLLFILIHLRKVVLQQVDFQGALW